MATTKARKATTTKAKAKPAPEPEVLEDDDLVEDADDVEELDEDDVDEVSDTKPATKKSTAVEVTFGIRDLVNLVKKKTGQDTDPRGLRTLIRKMARDESGRVTREIVPGNRSRYDWSGPNDPEVVAIVKAFAAGELEDEKKAKLAALKESKALKTAAKKKAAASEEIEEVEDDEDEAPKLARRSKKAAAGRRKKAAPVEEVEDDDELELDDEDDE